jgi:hypothetical protein
MAASGYGRIALRQHQRVRIPQANAGIIHEFHDIVQPFKFALARQA